MSAAWWLLAGVAVGALHVSTLWAAAKRRAMLGDPLVVVRVLAVGVVLLGAVLLGNVLAAATGWSLGYLAATAWKARRA